MELHISCPRPGAPDLGMRYDETEADVRLTPLQALALDKEIAGRWLWTMPLMSAQELADTTGLSVGRIYRVLKNLRRHGLATRASLGRAGGVRQRWWAHHSGCAQDRCRTGPPDTLAGD